jgi:uncharacterized protein (TIGR03118 family)
MRVDLGIQRRRVACHLHQRKGAQRSGGDMRSVMRITLAAVVLLGGCDDNNNNDNDIDIDETPPIGGELERCFTRVDLVSSVAGAAVRTDPALINAWGITPELGAFAIVAADNGTLAMYNADGSPATRAIPNGLPIGNGFTGAASSGDLLVLANEDGFLAAINPAVEPTRVDVVFNKDGAGFFGVAAFDTGFLAADFHQGLVKVFDANFNRLSSPTFVTPSLPAGFSPFNVAVLDGVVYVAYAQLNAAGTDEVHGAGLGQISAFDLNGTLLWTMSGTQFNAPWGMAIAPAGFGDLEGMLLVGNFGDGHINIINPATQENLGQLSDVNGNPIVTDGLWGLSRGDLVDNARLDSIYFTAGPADETQGLYGVLTPCE